jgi:hypothetical protein
MPCYWLCIRANYIRTDKQACCWHHKSYKLCSVFSTAAYVIWSLTQKPDILFLHENKKEECASWWDIPLIDWDAYNGEYFLFCNLMLSCTQMTYHILLKRLLLQQGKSTKLLPHIAVK